MPIDLHWGRTSEPVWPILTFSKVCSLPSQICLALCSVVSPCKSLQCLGLETGKQWTSILLQPLLLEPWPLSFNLSSLLLTQILSEQINTLHYIEFLEASSQRWADKFNWPHGTKILDSPWPLKLQGWKQMAPLEKYSCQGSMPAKWMSLLFTIHSLPNQWFFLLLYTT